MESVHYLILLIIPKQYHFTVIIINFKIPRTYLELLVKLHLLLFRPFLCYMGYVLEQLFEALHYKPEGCQLDPRWCHWNFPLTLPFGPHCGPRIDTDSNKNEFQEYFWRIKAAGAYGWQSYHFCVPIILKSKSLNLLEPLATEQGLLYLYLCFTFTFAYVIFSSRQ
jgi:hypothetical protein